MKKRRKQSITIIIGFLNLIALFSMAQNPVPGFAVNQTSGCSPLTIQFTNQSANTISSYWDFGNGSFSSLSNPSTVYTIPGTYSIKLMELSPTGQKDSIIVYDWITVLPKITSDFYSENTSSCLDGNVFSFVNTSLNSAACLWDFGDGKISAIQNPSHSYSTSGNFTVKLIVHNNSGCSDIKTMVNYIHVIPKPTASFSVNTTAANTLNQIFNFTAIAPSANSWLWKFGDGSSSALSNPHHTYSNIGTYTISLITANTNGCFDSLVKKNYISVTSSILLTAELNNGNVQLNWTKYEGWSEGIDHYIIEKMDEHGEWKIIKKVDGNQLIHEVE